MWAGWGAAYELGVDADLDLQVVPGPPEEGRGGMVWTIWASGAAGLDGPVALHKDGPGFLVQLPTATLGPGRVAIGAIALPASATGPTSGVVTLVLGAREVRATYGLPGPAAEADPKVGVAHA